MNSKPAWILPKSFIQSLIAAIQIIQNVQIIGQIERSGENVKNGRVRAVREFLKELYSWWGYGVGLQM